VQAKDVRESPGACFFAFRIEDEQSSDQSKLIAPLCGSDDQPEVGKKTVLVEDGSSKELPSSDKTLQENLI